MKPALLLIDCKAGLVRRFVDGKPRELAELQLEGDIRYIKQDLEMFRRHGTAPEAVDYSPEIA